MITLLCLLFTIESFAATKDAEGNIIADETTKNDELFEATVNVEPKFSQEESFIVQSNVMYNCVDTSLNGRQDDICVTNPKAPECVGLKKTLENATNCLEYFVPATLGCKTYGTAEHPAEDWVAFGNNYFTTLSQCTGTKTTSDDTKQKLQSLTEMIVYDPNSIVSSGPTLLKNYSQSGWNSTISETKKEEGVFSKLWNDGSSLLGYQDGDILKSAAKGDSFLDVVINSPFANDLNVVNREKLENGITNSAIIIERIKSAGKLPTMAAEEDTAPSIESSVSVDTGKIGIPTSQQNNTPQSSQSSTSLPGPGFLSADQVNATAFTSSPTTQKADTSEKLTQNSTQTVESSFGRKPLLAERIAQMELAAKQKKEIRSLASEEKPDSEDTANSLMYGSEEVSLFQRVRKFYSKRQEGFRAMGAKTTESILQIEKPKIFEEL